MHIKFMDWKLNFTNKVQSYYGEVQYEKSVVIFLFLKEYHKIFIGYRSLDNLVSDIFCLFSRSHKMMQQ